MIVVKKNRGLSLAELLAVVVILGIVATISIVLIGNIIENTRTSALTADCQTVESTIITYCIDHEDENICILKENDEEIDLTIDLPSDFDQYISIDFIDYDVATVNYYDDLGYVVSLEKNGITVEAVDDGYLINMSTNDLLDAFKDLTLNKLVITDDEGVITPSTLIALDYSDNESLMDGGELIVTDITGGYFKLYLYSTKISIINTITNIMDVHGNNIIFDNSSISQGFIWNDSNAERFGGSINPYKESLSFVDSYYKGTVGNNAYELVEVETVNVENSIINPNSYYVRSELNLNNVPFHTLNIKLDNTSDNLTVEQGESEPPNIYTKFRLIATDVFTNKNGENIVDNGSIINTSGDTGLYILSTSMNSLNTSAGTSNTKLVFNLSDNSYISLNNTIVYADPESNNVTEANNQINIDVLLSVYDNIDINFS